MYNYLHAGGYDRFKWFPNKKHFKAPQLCTSCERKTGMESDRDNQPTSI